MAILSGTICDGAKPSCAAKIASSVEAGILGYLMHKNGQDFKGGDGILADDVDNTVSNVGVLARKGMLGTCLLYTSSFMACPPFRPAEGPAR